MKKIFTTYYTPIFVVVAIIIAIYICLTTKAYVYDSGLDEVAKPTIEQIIEQSVETESMEISMQETSSIDVTLPTSKLETVVEETETKDVELYTEPIDMTIKATEPIEIEEDKTAEEFINLGRFKLTAYCSCEKCCGKWAYNRPKDESGNEIVYGSIGERLISGVSIAVDPDIIPYYSEVIINGNTYIAHDTGGHIEGNRIDLYFDNHDEALKFGVQYADVLLRIKNNY